MNTATGYCYCTFSPVSSNCKEHRHFLTLLFRIRVLFILTEDWSEEESIDRSIERPTDRPIDRPIDGPTDRPANESPNPLTLWWSKINKVQQESPGFFFLHLHSMVTSRADVFTREPGVPFNHLIINWLIYWRINWWNDRLIAWLVHWSMCRCIYQLIDLYLDWLWYNIIV